MKVLVIGSSGFFGGWLCPAIAYTPEIVASLAAGAGIEVVDIEVSPVIEDKHYIALWGQR